MSWPSKSGNCINCNLWRTSLHHDHIIPKWQGGTDDEINIQHLCANCHEDKTAIERASQAYKDFVSQRVTKRMLSKRARRRIGAAVRRANAARVWTPEMRQRCARKGIKRAPFTAEHRARISAARLGMSFTKKHLKALSLSHRSKPWSALRRERHAVKYGKQT